MSQQEVVRRRRAFLTAMAELLRRRRAIQAGMQPTPERPEGSIAGLSSDYLRAADTVERVQQNLEKDHSLVRRFTGGIVHQVRGLHSCRLHNQCLTCCALVLAHALCTRCGRAWHLCRLPISAPNLVVSLGACACAVHLVYPHLGMSTQRALHAQARAGGCHVLLFAVYPSWAEGAM